MMTGDQVEKARREAAEQAAAYERARQQNIRVFTEMYLGFGADVVKIAGTGHDAELAEATSLAAYRWNQLLGMESQVQATSKLCQPGRRSACPSPGMTSWRARSSSEGYARQPRATSKASGG